MCEKTDGKRYRYVGGGTHKRKHENRVITTGTVINGICPHEKDHFGDQFKPLGEQGTVQEQKQRVKLDQLTVSQLQKICKEVGLKGYSDMRKDQLVDYVDSNTENPSEFEEVLKEDEKEDQKKD